MTTRMRSFVTLSVLAAILMVGAVGGWRALTQPVPERSSARCVDTDVAAGSVLTPDQVAIRIMNASGQAGLASRTMEALTARGFASAGTGNLANSQITGIRIWSDDPSNPAVVLLRSQFKKAKVVTGMPSDEPGLVIVLGKKPSKLSRTGLNEILLETDAQVCSPPAA